MGVIYCPKTTSGFNISTQNDSVGISYKLSYRQKIKVQILALVLSSKGQYLGPIYFKNLPKIENVRKMSQNNNSGNPLTSRHTDGGKNENVR